jgi:folate-dependent phosphoribosylglycinamide formyltransferase PurN
MSEPLRPAATLEGSERARLRIAWLTTGRGPGSYGALDYLLDAMDDGLPVEIAVLFVNRERGESEATDGLLDMAQDRGLAVETLSSVRFRKANGGKLSKPGEPLPPWRAAYDAEVALRLEKHDFSLGVMFGYMLIATEPLYGRFPFLNDHPALPDGPIGTYQEVIAELMRSGAAESGCMMNLVSGDVDRGPVVSVCHYSIRDAATEGLWRANATEPDAVAATESPLYAEIRRRGVERERPFLVETLRALAARELSLPPAEPLDLTARVEALVGER